MWASWICFKLDLVFKHFSYWVLENEAKPLKDEGERVQEIAEKIRYLMRDAFVDDP